MAQALGLLRPGERDGIMFEALSNGLRKHAEKELAVFSAQEAEEAIQFLQNSGLATRWYVFRIARQEMRARNIDWDGIGDFFVKIAPIVMEIIKMLMGL